MILILVDKRQRLNKERVRKMNKSKNIDHNSLKITLLIDMGRRSC